MKIELVSYDKNLSSKIKRNLTLKLINNSKSDIIIFPGNTVDTIKDLDFISVKITNKNIVAFMELKTLNPWGANYWSFKVQNGEILNCSTHQLFAYSSDINKNHYCAENLYSELITKRTHYVNGKKICLLICGELNILTNQQSVSNKVKIRVEDNELKKKFQKYFNDIDIIINPMHTPMGNQGKMEMRRKFLTKKKKSYFSTSNLDSSSKNMMKAFLSNKSLQYAYYNQKPIKQPNEEYSDQYLSKMYELKI